MNWIVSDDQSVPPAEGAFGCAQIGPVALFETRQDKTLLFGRPTTSGQHSVNLAEICSLRLIPWGTLGLS